MSVGYNNSKVKLSFLKCIFRRLFGYKNLSTKFVSIKFAYKIQLTKSITGVLGIIQ